MKGKNLSVLLLILIILASGAYLSQRKKTAQNVEVNSGTSVFADFDVNAVEKIEVRSVTQKIVYRKVDGKWVAPDKFNYPIDFSRVVRMVQSFADLKVGQHVRASESQRDSFQLVDPESETMTDPRNAGTRIVLKDAGDNVLVELIIGKMHEEASKEGVQSPSPDGFMGGSSSRYVYVDGKVFLVGARLADAPTRARDWLRDDVASIYSRDVAEVSLEGEDRETIKLVLGDDGQMVLDGLDDDEEGKTGEIMNLASALSYMKFDDIADPETDDETTGFGDGVIFRAVKKDGTVYTVTIGKETDDERQRYMKIAVTCDAPAPAPPLPDEPEEAVAERNNQYKAVVDAAAEHNARVGKWVYLLRDRTARAFLVERDSLFKDRDEDD